MVVPFLCVYQLTNHDKLGSNSERGPSSRVPRTCPQGQVVLERAEGRWLQEAHAFAS